ncbi:unnamed protein product, partial [marine sediment metagenome]
KLKEQGVEVNIQLGEVFAQKSRHQGLKPYFWLVSLER